ncbi:hypothetical protein GSI_04628 [Ganoderma sinense ZZ0214-1]|uniref:Uncharacterized protein n=1 Tax=Ganoderma sinense ZZ0214-1 TaxID=1077348 RepID=A0A2G8SHY6_9APHY|nr:hypothetical protein GSI_04628 [Ganoderma sinense ZZ0214-1]
MPGTRHSGTLPTITEVKMDVFLPIVLFREQPQTRIAFARMVQYFTEEIGLPAMQRLTKATSFKPPKVLTTAADATPRLNAHALFPSSNTPWHILYGRDIGILERLIAEQIVVAGAAPETSSITPRLLPSRVPEVFTPPAQSSSISDFKKGKQAEDKPWTVDDVRRYAEQFESCGENNDAGRRAIMQQVSTRLPELFGIVVNLARRVNELEISKQTQLFEVQSLRRALQDSSDQHLVDMTRIVTETAAPSVPETTRRSSHKFENEGPSKTGNPMTSLIPSVAIPPSHPPTYDTRRGESGLSLGGGKMFGPYTDALLTKHGLPRRTHTILRDVEKTYPVERWMQALRLKVEGCSDDIAQTLVEAMKADRRMTTRTRS